MKNRKGFTLVELMSVIVVLAIIIAIAVPAYNRIKLSIDKKNYENKVSLIEVAASKYTEDTRYETMYVNDLIVNGYLDADNKNGEIFNDITGEKINCYLVQSTEEAGIYYSKLIETEYDFNETDKTCPANIPNDYNQIVKINMFKEDGSTPLTNDEYAQWWTNTNVKLQVVVNTSKTVEKIEWYKGYSPTPISESDEAFNIAENNNQTFKYWLRVSTESVLQENYTVKVTFDNGEVLNSTVRVYIDKINPGFYDNNAKNLDSKWETQKNYNVKAYDNESGLYGYRLYTSTEALELATDDQGKVICPTQRSVYTRSKKNSISGNDKYTICIMDNVGNTEIDKFDIYKIDNTKMKCNIAVETGTVGNNVNGVQWYKGDSLTLKVTPEAIGPSGVSLGIADKNTETYTTAFVTDSASAFESKTLSSNINGTTYYGFVKNQANTKNSCNMKVYYEKSITAPSLTKSTSTYNTITAEYTSGSAISQIASTTCELTDANGTKTGTGTLSGNNCIFTVPATSANTTYYFKKCITSKAGNTICSSVSSKQNVGYCTEGNYTPTKTNTSCGSAPLCTTNSNGQVSVACTYTWKKVSKYNSITCGNEYTTTGNETRTTHVCCNEVQYIGQSACSNVCGGTSTKYAYDKYDSTHSCSSKNAPVSCGGVWYANGSTCTNVCGGGTYNRIAYSTIDNSRCTAYDLSSGGSACGGKVESSRSTCSATCPTACGQAASTQTGTQTVYYKSTIDGSSCGSTSNVSCSKSCAATAACCTKKPTVLQGDDNKLIFNGTMCNNSDNGWSIVPATKNSGKINLENSSIIKYKVTIWNKDNQYSNGLRCYLEIQGVGKVFDVSETMPAWGGTKVFEGSYTVPSSAKKTDAKFTAGMTAQTNDCPNRESDGTAYCRIDYIEVCK